MYVEQLYTNCLAQAAYYIESEGEAAIIDPMRETEPYMELAAKRGAKIKYIFETHFHADFVSGHIDLAKLTGAKIIYGPGANAEYDIYVAHDHENFPLGKVNLQLWHTPGHTLESSCILLENEQHEPHAIFTGDTLFVGDAGRPDLAVKSDLTKEDLASLLYDSLQKIKTLPDSVILYPGHGPGSACGKNIGKETVSTVGNERMFNHAMAETNREVFVKNMTEGLPTPPKYFFKDAAINKKGYEDITEIMQRNGQPLAVAQVKEAIAKGALVLDTRPADDFEKGYIPNAINIGLNGSFAQWVGALLEIERPIIVIAEEGREQEAVLRLARIGFVHVLGFLNGGFDSWKKAGEAMETVQSVEAVEFAAKMDQGKILDVRNPGEFSTVHLSEAKLTPLGELDKHLSQLSKDTAYYVHCAGGYRSMAAASLLKAHGFQKVINVRGGMNKIIEAGCKVVTE